MRPYEGLTENDLKIIQIALQKLPITGAESSMMSNLLQKVQMELELLQIPKEERPNVGDIITKE